MAIASRCHEEDPVQMEAPALVDVCIRTIGERLQYLRSIRQLTLEQAAHITRISRAEISRLENDERRLSDLHLSRLARAYNIPLHELRCILDYKVAPRPEPVPVPLGRKQTEKECQLSSCLVSEFVCGHDPGFNGQQVTVPILADLSCRAYAIVLNSVQDPFLGPNATLVADPERCVRIGDLVLNTVGRTPPLIRVSRQKDGALQGNYGVAEIGFGLSVSLSSFHKVVAILTTTGLQAYETLSLSQLLRRSDMNRHGHDGTP